jgi:ParB family transcriptional regulator, chromosome partitioning protein
MKESDVTLVDPKQLDRNPDNPRLVFREDEMQALLDSIRAQGILVPLTVYRQGKLYRLLDGERRWRSSLKLGMPRVPVIVQPKPERLANIMMMFAIHHAREDWDPLPTALKLEELEKEFERRTQRKPTEKELAGLASMSRGEVRRLKKLLALPKKYRTELLAELKKPRSQQVLTVDHVIEARNAAYALKKREIVDESGEEQVRAAIIKKFRSGVINNTVAPRKLAKLARAVGRGDVSLSTAKAVVSKVVNRPKYTIDNAFTESVEQVDFEHNLSTLAERVDRLLNEHKVRGYRISAASRLSLETLVERIQAFLRPS